MSRIFRNFVVLIAATTIIGLVLCGNARADVPLNPYDLAVARDAFNAADRGKWSDAEQIAARAGNRLPLKIIQWFDYLRPQAGHSFEELTGFINNNPNWPLLATLRLRVEDGLNNASDPTIAQWFTKHKPVTPSAKIRFADLLLAQGKTAEATALIKSLWIDSEFSPEDEARIRVKYAAILHQDDDIHRLDRLLWDDKPVDAKRMFGRVPPDWSLLAQARIGLTASAKNVDALVAKVPRELANDPGLAFERVRWNRRKDHDQIAADLMERQSVLGRPDIWWPERQIIARRLWQQNQAAQAYRLIIAHQTTDPSSVADAEFTAGWIALRFLKSPDQAASHFQRLSEIAKLPVTLSRGAYWAGRAAEAAGHSTEAIAWYEKAAAYPTTFYGQLAAAKPGVTLRDKPQPEPVATPAEKAIFEQKELVQAIRILIALGEQDRMRPFLYRLPDSAQTPDDYAQIADFAAEIGRPDLGVVIAKKASYNNVSLLRAGWPIVWVPRNAGTEQALLLALTRQESAFELRAISPTGARGLMQLMPGTAKDTAKVVGLVYSNDRLLTDGEFNVTLGQAYFDSLLNFFNGSYALSIAAYNAGPARVEQWLQQFGDPRQGSVDPVDWVESIPFSETRNYVQRVMENLQVYRLRIGNPALAFSLEADLRR